MPGSQQTFEARETKFGNGNTLIQSWGDYNSANALTSKASLNTFVGDVHNGNLLAESTLDTLNGFRDTRLNISFKIKETNPTCLELRFEAIASYIKGEIGVTSAAYKAVKRVLKKIQPRYPKKEEGAPRGAGKSPSEKSFTSLVGQGDIVIAVITNLGGAYNPADPNLSVANITALVNQIRQLNNDVTIALDNYGKANRARKAIFDAKTTGMTRRISLIRSYLASFPGGKKSDHYIEFNQAIKGV